MLVWIILSICVAAVADEFYHDQDLSDGSGRNGGAVQFADSTGVGWRDFNVGVLMASHLDSPFDLERCGPAVDLALERVNEEFLKAHKVRLRKVQGRYARFSDSNSNIIYMK